MKKVSIGLGFIISAVILYSVIHLSATIYLPNVHEWSTPPGRFYTALEETSGVLPTIISILMGIIGVYLICSESVNMKRIVDKLKDY